MKSEKEKKSVVKSIKLSPNQEKFIKGQAEIKNMNFSEYMVDCAVHGNKGITPQIAVKMQEIVNIVTDIADSLDSNEYIRKQALRQKADELNGLFNSPQDKLKTLESNMNNVISGGQKIWEYLG